MVEFGVLSEFLCVELLSCDLWLVGDCNPITRSNDGKLHGGLEVGLIEAGKDPVGSVGLKVCIDILLILVVETDAACAIVIVFVGIHDGDLVSTLLQKLFGKDDEVLSGLRVNFDRVDDDLLDLSSLEVDFELGEVEILNVEVHLCEAVVFCRGDDDVVVVADASRAYEILALISCVLIETHPIKNLLRY